MCSALFFNRGFILFSFPGMVFNDAYYDTKGCCTLFPSLEFFPVGFSLVMF